MTLNCMSLFTGIGGFDLGFERAGMTTVAMCEKDKPALGVLDRHWPDVEKIIDVRKVSNGNRPGAIDLICGGFPCQDVSLAGKRAGLAGERSGLWFQFARVIDEFEPAWVVIENVAGLLSSNEGRDFETIIRWMGQRGYGTAYRVLDSQYFGVAQRRRRVFIVGSFGSGRSAEVLLEPQSSSWNTPPSREAGEGIADTFTIRSGKDGGGKGYLGQESLAMTLGGQQQHLAYSRQRSDEYKESEIVSTISQRDYKSATDLSEVYRESGTIAPTLQARMGTGGNNVPMVGVRRLTPLECERLQGFPDGWTDGQSDSARYKQLGNAVTVPVAEWIGNRIMKASQ